MYGRTDDESQAPSGVFWAWLREGARAACLRRPKFDQLDAGPAMLLFLLTSAVLLGLLIERLLIPGPATFYAPAIQGGWLATVVELGLCWMVVRHATHDGLRPSVPTLFGVLIAQGLVIALISGAVLVPLTRTEWLDAKGAPERMGWALWLCVWAWFLIAQLVLLLRLLRPRRALQCLVAMAASVPFFLDLWMQPPAFWYPVYSDVDTEEPLQLRFTQEVMERQPKLLSAALKAMAPQRASATDIYAITFAPYSREDVFRRESDLVASVMHERFDAEGRTLQLVNHRDTALELPWATPLNLERAISHLAKVMDPDEDVLFIHLTSHGAADGKLSASLWPLELKPVTPALLKRWLDTAGIRYRVISVSACYSGSWIKPLAGEGTLVMTASDARHTSYGCGRHSELTYFGRAVYDEQLRRTFSFEQAHATARGDIEQREREAGKDDGYSNPQISVGGGIRTTLSRLEARLTARAASGKTVD